jgi:hypothetical protein
MITEYLLEWELVEETEVLGENLSQYHLFHYKSNMTSSGLEPGPVLLEAGD